MKKNEIRICIVDTPYSLFLYYLICGLNDNDIIITSEFIPESIRNNFKHIYFKKIPYDEYFEASSSCSKFIKKIKVRLITIYEIMALRLILFIKTIGKNVKVYGHGHLPYSFPIYEHNNAYLIEEGLVNYIDLPEAEYYVSFVRLYNFFGAHIKNYYGGFGTHRNIKKIFLTKDNAPKIIEDKVEVVNMLELWESKSDDEKNRILKIFNIDDFVDKLENHITLFLTQCFSPDKLLSYDEEISIYKYLIEKQHTKNIVIKPHPREKRDLKAIFPEFTVIDKPFPFEILSLMGLKIDKAITVSSTAVLNLSDACEVEIYDKQTSNEKVNEGIETLRKQLVLQKNQ